MNEYEIEQLETLQMIRRYLKSLDTMSLRLFESDTADYLSFRSEVHSFLCENFSSVCTLTCFQNHRSACCTREGIIIYFADVVVNALVASEKSLDRLERILEGGNTGSKCIYLASDGCSWTVKPIVCEMFLCDVAKKKVFGSHPRLEERWDEFRERRNFFTWPDKPVLFDAIEKRFLAVGLSSPLMYYHNSPGLIRVKRKWEKE